MNLLRAVLFCLLPSICLLAENQTMAKENEMLVYFGTFPKSGSKGIYLSRLNMTSGKLTEPELAAAIGNCGFLAIHPNKKFMYAVGDLNGPDGKSAGAVNAFSIDPGTGQLTYMNQQSVKDRGPTHLVVDHSGKVVLVANYGGGSVTALPIQENGQLAEATAFIEHTGSSLDPNRQKESHAHSINLSPDNRFALVADLGIDKVLVYKFDATKGTLRLSDPAYAPLKPGAGPRHLAWHPNGYHCYVINEIDCTVTAFEFERGSGILGEIQTVSTLPEGQKVENNFSTAEIVVHPSGKFVYGSNRGHDTIAVFSVEKKTGKLKLIQNEPTQGKIPRNFNVDPTGKFLLAANMNSDTVVIFRIDQKTGRLKPTGQSLNVLMPVCVKFMEVADKAPKRKQTADLQN